MDKNKLKDTLVSAAFIYILGRGFLAIAQDVFSNKK